MWDLLELGNGICTVLEPIGLTSFPAPPLTFNVPALVVKLPDTLEASQRIVGLDVVTLAVIVAVGIDDYTLLGGLINQVRALLASDPTLAGSCRLATVTGARQFGPMIVAAATYLTGQVFMEVHT